MGTIGIISPHNLHQLSRPRTAEPSRLQQNTLLAGRIAYCVETRWAQLPDDARVQLKKLAYELIDPPRGLHNRGKRFLGHVILAFVVLRGEVDALYEYLAAVHRLVNAILSAVENEQRGYEEALAAAVDSALADSDLGKPLDAEGIRVWLSAVSDQAHREL